MKRRMWFVLGAFLYLHFFAGCVAVVREKPVFPENSEIVIARSDSENREPRHNFPCREVRKLFGVIGKSAFFILEQYQRICLIPMTSAKVDKVRLKVDLLVVLK